MQTNNYCISSFLTMQQYHIHTPTIYAAQSTKMNHHVQPVVAVLYIVVRPFESLDISVRIFNLYTFLSHA